MCTRYHAASALGEIMAVAGFPPEELRGDFHLYFGGGGLPLGSGGYRECVEKSRAVVGALFQALFWESAKRCWLSARSHDLPGKKRLLEESPATYPIGKKWLNAKGSYVGASSRW